MKTKLTVTTPDGHTLSRTTDANYTHATLILEDVKGVKEWGVVAWSGSESLARKQYDKWSKVGCVIECLVVEVNKQ